MRKTELSHEDLTERALAEAERLVREGGRRALSMRLIARAASCASGTIYNVIGDIDDVILHLNARTTARLADRLDAAAAACSDPLECIRAMAHAYVELGEVDPELWSLLFDYRLPPGRELPDWYREILARPIEGVHRAARPAFADDAAARAFVARIWVALHGVVALSITGKLTILIDRPRSDFVDDLVDAHLAAVGLTPAAPPC